MFLMSCRTNLLSFSARLSRYFLDVRTPCSFLCSRSYLTLTIRDHRYSCSANREFTESFSPLHRSLWLPHQFGTFLYRGNWSGETDLLVISSCALTLGEAPEIELPCLLYPSRKRDYCCFCLLCPLLLFLTRLNHYYIYFNLKSCLGQAD